MEAETVSKYTTEHLNWQQQYTIATTRDNISKKNITHSKKKIKTTHTPHVQSIEEQDTITWFQSTLLSRAI